MTTVDLSPCIQQHTAAGYRKNHFDEANPGAWLELWEKGWKSCAQELCRKDLPVAEKLNDFIGCKKITDNAFAKLAWDQKALVDKLKDNETCVNKHLIIALLGLEKEPEKAVHKDLERAGYVCPEWKGKKPPKSN